MDIGELRKRIAVLKNTPAQDDAGGMTPNWATYLTAWGSISPLSGREQQAANQIQATITHEVTLRWPGTSYTLDPSMRLSYGGRLFDIQGIVNDDERNRTLTLSCVERVGEE